MVNARSDESALGSRFALGSEEIKLMIEVSCGINTFLLGDVLLRSQLLLTFN